MVGNGPAISGLVLAGRSPLQGALVEVYAAGTAGNGSAPTQLLAAALVTDTGGAFHVAAGSYSCPAAGSILYAVSTGGQVGTQTPNAAVSLLAVLGRCDGVSSGTYVLNELSTIATALVLRPFLAAGGQIGSSATNAGGLALSVAELGALVDAPTGSAPGATLASNAKAPVAKLNTLANALHGCAASPGAGSSPCSTLFAQAPPLGGTAPANTLDAALGIANQPGLHVAALFQLAGQGQAFSPVLSTAPVDWIPAVVYEGGGLNGPTSVSIDSVGRVWVANYFGVASLFSNNGLPLQPAGFAGSGLYESYGGAVDSLDRMWLTNQQTDSSVNNGLGSVTLLNSTGPALSGSSQFTGGGLNFPTSVSFDRSGTAWIVDYGDSSITLLDSAGNPLSGASGYSSSQLSFPVAVAVDSRGNGWVANLSGTTVTRVTPDGSSMVSFTTGRGPAAVAVDATDSVWVANYYDSSIGLVSSMGQVQSNGGFAGGGLDHPTGIAVDGAGTAWVANYRGAGVTALAGSAAAMPGAALSPSTGWGSDLELLEAFGVAVDAAGNVWVTSYGDNRLIELPGAAAPVKTPLLGGVRVP